MSKEHMERLQVLRYADSDVRRCRVRRHRCSFRSYVCMSVYVSLIPLGVQTRRNQKRIHRTLSVLLMRK